MILGSHVKFGQEQMLGSAKSAINYGANAFMFYTGAPQNTIRRKIDDNLIKEAHDYMKVFNIDINNVIVHAPYIINLANKEKIDSWHFSINFLKSEIKRCVTFGVKYIVLHPGSHVNHTKDEGLKNIVDALNKVLENENNITILLESMAGKGSECGSSLEELKYIIDNVENSDQLGVCLDTCHLNDAGYDMSKIDEFLVEFDKVLSFDRLKCFHINDSKNILGSKKDRHANIGYGTIGFDNLIKIIYHPKLKDVPKILETPWLNDNPPYKFEIEMIKQKCFNEFLINDINTYYKNEENL